MSSIFLGADIGTTSAKCLAVDSDGAILAIAQHPYGLAHPRQGWAEQDPEDYWRALSAVVRACVQQIGDAGMSAGDIASLALSTQGDTLVIYDSSGCAVRPAISWMDCRATNLFEKSVSEVGQQFWYAETGHKLTPYRSVCSIWWLAENEPETLKAGRIGWVPDYMSLRLTGRCAVDTPSASWTPLFSPARRTWSGAVLEQLGVREDGLPDVLESGETIAALLPAAAEELGLSKDVRLVSGAFDQAAAAHGASAAPGGRSVLSCGTAWVLYGVSGSPVVDPGLGVSGCCHVRAGEWGMVLPFSGGTVYDWARRTLAGEAAKTADSPNEPLIFIPHLYGGLSPDWRQESRGTIVGLTLSHTPEDIELAVMRGLVFEARRNMDACEALAGRPERIRMVGGATHSAFWPQLAADILALPVEVWDCSESACYGAAKLAAGALSDGWTGGAVRVIEPRPERVEAESATYERYLRAYANALDFYSA